MFSLDGGNTVFITTGPININDNSMAPSGAGLLCQSEIEIPGDAGSRHWFINPEIESTASEDQLVNGGDNNRGWVRTRNTLSNNIQQAIMRRQSASGSVEGVFTCQLGNDINPIRSLSVLYPSELLLTYYNISLLNIIL